MLLALSAVLIGGLLLYLGAQWLVKGSVQLAFKLQISPLIIGLTVVSCGTSMPEAIASLVANLTGKGDIAFGNVIGSNIANFGLVMGVASILCPIKISPVIIRIEMPILLVISTVFTYFSLNLEIFRWQGAFFLLGIFAYLIYQVQTAKSSRQTEREAEEALPISAKTCKHSSSAFWIVIGLFSLFFGGYCLVEGGAKIARIIGISERVIGISIVAIGTSAPELATSLVAAFRGHGDLAIGNLVGSNIFNILFIIGIVASLSPISFSSNFIGSDLPMMVGMTMLLWAMMFYKKSLSRIDGMILLVLYSGYICSRFF